MSDHDDIQHLDPDQLLTGFSRTPFLLAFLLSIFAHVIFLALFSLTPLLDMVLPKAESPVVVEEVSPPPEAELGPPVSEEVEDSAATPRPASDPARAAPAPATEPTHDNGDNDTDDFDIDLDVLNR